jgi:hypothetical protein
MARRISGSRGLGHGPTIGVSLGGADRDRQDVLGQVVGDLDALRDEVAVLRRELEEAHNRLDFTERLLAQARERGLLSAPKERGPS